MIKEPERERRLYDGEEAAVLAAAGAHLADVVVALLDTGCRIGEVLSLQWHQVTLGREPVIALPAGKTKTKRPRTIPITSRLKKVLARRRHDPGGEEHLPHAFVFGTATGERIKDVKTAWRRTCQRAKITDLHIHDLRREAGSRWVDAGVPLSQVQTWLGHAKVSQTATYVRPRVGHGNDTMARAEATWKHLQRIAKKRKTQGVNRALAAENANSSPQHSAEIATVH